MGIRFVFANEKEATEFTAAVDSLEKLFLSGKLSDRYLV